ncbi:MAG TPA: ribosome maturation factor RimM [Woeseiaceae bacterium]|nr:ribosome maturation factor RimM [Woeseiaceae bacterium]
MVQDDAESPATGPVGGPGARAVILGRISGLFGVRGWIKVFSYTEPREALLDYKEWLVGETGAWRPVTVAEAKTHGQGLVARLAGTEDRDTAAGYIGADIAVARERLPETEQGEYYWADLEGLEVRHRDGRVLGRLSRMLATGAHDVMEVRREGQEREILVPFVPDDVVLAVNLEKGVIDVDWEWD